jgi:hypothetical protein
MKRHSIPVLARSFDDSSTRPSSSSTNVSYCYTPCRYVPWPSYAMADPSHRSAFLKILNQPSNPASSSDISDNLKRLRRLVLTRSIPEDSKDEDGISIRARVWKLLLRIDRVSTEEYLRWVDMGPSEMSAKSKSSALISRCCPADPLAAPSQERYLSNSGHGFELQGKSQRGHAHPTVGSIRVEEQSWSSIAGIQRPSFQCVRREKGEAQIGVCICPRQVPTSGRGDYNADFAMLYQE